jgi:hypothetical protein
MAKIGWVEKQKQKQMELIAKHLEDPLWRLNNLYKIVDKEGRQTDFRFNWPQQKLYKEMWFLNIVLKARQMGMSTFVGIFFLDRCLFYANTSAGIIAHTREDAEHMFKRVKFAYDQLPDCIKTLRTATVDSARELVFNNHSSLRVGTSMRGSTLQYLHISEFGKICSHFPDKAREIISGSLNTLGSRQYVFIESTAEGKEGHFYDLCKLAEADKIANKKLTPLDYRFHFFPWFECPEYRIEEDIVIPQEIDNYFLDLEAKGIDLSQEQKNWYYKKLLTQKDDMMREFPSTADEAFESSVDGSFYAKWIREARFEGRISAEHAIPWDKDCRVNVVFDPGILDACAVIWFQCIGQEIHVIDYYEHSGEGFAHYADVIKKKPYVYDKYFGPHDIESHQFAVGLSTKERAAQLGIPLITLNTLRTKLEDGIEAVRSIFHRVWIDTKNCSRLVKCLENYRKEFDVDFQIYKSRPCHDQYSHGADSFRYMALAIKAHIDEDKGGITDAEAERLYNRYHPRFE